MDTKQQPINLVILFGGKSAEHEVSLQSAKNIINALDRTKYTIIPIGIDKQGVWRLYQEQSFLKNPNDPKHIALGDGVCQVALVPNSESTTVVNLETGEKISPLEAVFPVLHGTYGEDGTMQGILRVLDVPFVGADVLGSAIGMDKDVCKRLLKEAGLPIAQYLCFMDHQRSTVSETDIIDRISLPLFVKPANLGSSVGITKVNSVQELGPALELAFSFDHKIIIEKGIAGREIECSVLGNHEPQASLPGEIIPHDQFYSYKAKYIDDHGADLIVPADLPAEAVTKIQTTAVKVFQVLCCEGMARVDFFYTENGEIIVNEINTIPGFTKISMYPKLWEASGISYPKLLDILIDLALQRDSNRKQLRTSYEV